MLTCCWHALSLSCSLAISVSDASVPESSSVFSRASTKRSASDCRDVSLDVATLHACLCLVPAGTCDGKHSLCVFKLDERGVEVLGCSFCQRESEE